MNETNAHDDQGCLKCHEPLPRNYGRRICPKCLLKAGLNPADLETGVAGGAGEALQAGQVVGTYRVVKELGGGGMGRVYEAEDLETGRRIALKLLRQSLDSPEARDRFLREGRLAAAINHPNSVYVFGTEEIGGIPAISMELVTGGTLEEKVRRDGPLPAREAVDAVLQIIEGLHAAQRAGILHRDVKPSNCFIDTEGIVKIGDFGLSISTVLKFEPSLTAPGSFLGTPAFCPPEQLRGDELNTQADVYAVGATLFYLLTGKTPFHAQNVLALVAMVLEQPAPSVAKLRPDVPAGLARIVAKCLNKHPAERFPTYGQLRDALAPYGSAAATPAPLGMRFLAGAVDTIIISAFVQTVLLAFGVSPFSALDLLVRNPQMSFAIGFIGWLLFVTYFAFFEGMRGATPGKMLFKLRVQTHNGAVPGLKLALPRAALFALPAGFPGLIAIILGPENYLTAPPSIQMAVGIVHYTLLALMFVTARNRNGFAAVHDLATKTRVSRQVSCSRRPESPSTVPLPTSSQGERLIGPYHVIDSMGHSGGVEWFYGYDLRLLRQVWIRTCPSQTPAYPARLRDLARPTRLRWLAGRRSAVENWDAFEAPGGAALLSRVAGHPEPWTQVRFWIQDLAAEIKSSQSDGTLPQALNIDQVWISRDGRAKLLDFSAPGLSQAGEPSSDNPDPGRFLSDVARASLTGKVTNGMAPDGAPAVPMPLYARDFLKTLAASANHQSREAQLALLIRRVPEVSRLRRAAILLGCIAFPAFTLVSLLIGTTVMAKWEREQPGLSELSALLHVRRAYATFNDRNRPSDRLIQVYIYKHFSKIINDRNVWMSGRSLALVNGESRQFAEQSVQLTPAPLAAEMNEAEKAVAPLARSAREIPLRDLFLMMGPVTLLVYVGLPALIAAMAFRGGLVLLLARVSFVRPDGRRATRLRVFVRAIVAWLPVCIAVIAVIAAGRPSLLSLSLAMGGCAVLAVASVLLPQRGLPDRIAGTWPVIR